MAKAKARGATYTGASNWWLNRARGRAVRLVLDEGGPIHGTLLSFDTFTLLVKVDTYPDPVMVSKSAVKLYEPVGGLKSNEEYERERDEARRRREAS